MLKKVDVLMPRYSQYSVLHHFAKKIFEAFQRTGLSCRLLEGEDRILVPADNPPDFTVGFNGMIMDDQKRLLCDLTKIPHLSCLVDPPYRFIYLVHSPYTIVTCDDRYCLRILDFLKFDRTLFMPHAVEPELSPDPNQERNFGVSLLATFIDYKRRKLQWPKKFPPQICKTMVEAADITFSDPRISFIEAFNIIYEALCKKYPKGKFENVSIIEALQELEYYIKGKDRVNLAKSVKDVPLHIFGSSIDALGWKTYIRPKKHPNVHFHGPVNYEQALQIMKRSKIILNPSLKNKDGAHERIFSGLACGALVITNESKFLCEEFKEDKEMIYYRPAELDKVNDKVLEYLSDEKKREAVVEKGRKKVMARHTWDNRVADLLKHLPKLLKEIQNKGGK